ncbi:hypothetical protein Dcar01_02791 [Deinococcus carri]|uniref:HTH cro/C1-type domain-containing protein n=1 Tax=Deinococcus carri TaxID=1211323 RepID=A0ABP9WCT2_9DEIO
MATTPSQTSPERILALREASKQSQLAVAKAAKVNRMTLGKLERQPCRRVDHFVLRRLAAALGAESVDDLLETA